MRFVAVTGLAVCFAVDFVACFLFVRVLFLVTGARVVLVFVWVRGLAFCAGVFVDRFDLTAVVAFVATRAVLAVGVFFAVVLFRLTGFRGFADFATVGVDRFVDLTLDLEVFDLACVLVAFD